MTTATRADSSAALALAALGLVAALCFSPAARAEQDKFQPQMPPDDVRAVQQAHSLRLAQRPKEAAALLQGVVARQPDYFNAQYELGLALSDTPGDVAKAAGPLEKAAALKRTRPEITDAHVFNSLGWVYLYTGQTAKAQSAFHEAEQHLDQLSPQVQRKLYNNLGYLNLASGNTADAEKYLKAAADKGSRQAQTSLSTLESINRKQQAQYKQ